MKIWQTSTCQEQPMYCIINYGSYRPWNRYIQNTPCKSITAVSKWSVSGFLYSIIYLDILTAVFSV